MGNKHLTKTLLLLGSILIPILPAYANITNGGFEDGLNGWTVFTNGDANPVAVTSGTTNASAGTLNPSLTNDNYIYSSQTGPGNSFIYQTFNVQAGQNKVFFDIAIINGAVTFTTPDSLDYTGASNQQARFDILRSGSAIDTVDVNDIIVTPYQTEVGDPATQDWQTIEVDVTNDLLAYVGQDVIFRFVQVDNSGVFNLALDNINVGEMQMVGNAVFVPISNNNLTDNTASVLDQILADGIDPVTPFGAALTSLSGLSDTEKAAALQKITPNTSSAMATVTSNVVQGGLNEIGGRINAIRSSGYNTGVTGMNSGDSMSWLERNAPQPNSFWGQASGFKADQDLKDGFAGYESLSKNILFGYDIIPAENWIFGAALGYTKTDVDMTDFRDGDSADIDSYQFSLYGSHEFQNKVVFDLIGSYARHEYEGNRNTTIDNAFADFGANHYNVRFDVARDFQTDAGFFITPKVGMEWSSMYQEGYEETGSVLGQEFESNTSYRLRSNTSVEIAKPMVLNNDLQMVPKVRLGWEHEFREEGTDSTSRFVGGGGQFSTRGQSLERNSYNLRTSLDLYTKENLQLGAAVEGEIAEDYKGYGGQIHMKWKF